MYVDRNAEGASLIWKKAERLEILSRQFPEIQSHLYESRKQICSRIKKLSSGDIETLRTLRDDSAISSRVRNMFNHVIGYHVFSRSWQMIKEVSEQSPKASPKLDLALVLNKLVKKSCRNGHFKEILKLLRSLPNEQVKYELIHDAAPFLVQGGYHKELLDINASFSEASVLTLPSNSEELALFFIRQGQCLIVWHLLQHIDEGAEKRGVIRRALLAGYRRMFQDEEKMVEFPKLLKKLIRSEMFDTCLAVSKETQYLVETEFSLCVLKNALVDLKMYKEALKLGNYVSFLDFSIELLHNQKYEAALEAISEEDQSDKKNAFLENLIDVFRLLGMTDCEEKALVIRHQSIQHESEISYPGR